MKTLIRYISVLVFVFGCAMSVSAEWRIDIESKTVNAGETGVTVDITVYWDLPLSQFSLPLAVREVDSGAFWSGDLPFDTSGNGFNHPYQHGVEWKWAEPWAGISEEVRPSIPVAFEFLCDVRADTIYDGNSPDQLAITAASAGFYADAEPTGRAVVTLTFDVTDVGGEFEFDTACMTTTLSVINMIDNKTSPVDHGPVGTGEVAFNKGVITIWKDTDEDGIADEDDNCPTVYNVGQEDNDVVPDSVGDACDNCPLTYNPDQEDGDEDGYGDSCDVCPDLYNPEQDSSDCDTNGILESNDAVPEDFALMQNYPNPFNATTLIEFVMAEGGHVRLAVYDILGRNVITLVDEYVDAGRTQAMWDGRNERGITVSSGIYFYRLTTTNVAEMKKMVLMK